MGTAALLALVYGFEIEPRWVELVERDVSVPGLPRTLEGLTIVELCDLHLGVGFGASNLAEAVKVVNRLAPDLIVLCGDIVSRRARNVTPSLPILASLRPKCGIYAVLGNHDVRTDPDFVARSLAQAGIAVLRNDAVVLNVNETPLWLLGIEDTGFTDGHFRDFRSVWQGRRDRLAALIASIPEDAPRLLLVHNPDFTQMLPAGRIDLALTGHTHGGQVRLPLVGALRVPSCFGQKFTTGLVTGPSTLVYTSRGLGTIPPAIRFLCRPEITLLRLHSR